jgi:hypothetical protein
MGLLDTLKAKQLDASEVLRSKLYRYTPDYSYGMAALSNGGNSQSSNGHYSDTGKLPNHPTFSDEALLSQEGMRGGHWSTDTTGQTSYTPSLDQVLKRNPQLSTEGLAAYMKNREPEVQLVSPIPVDPAYFHKVTK